MGREKSLKCAARDFKMLSNAAGDPVKAPGLARIELSSSSSSSSVMTAADAGPDEASIFHWRLTILPPEGSLYGGPHPKRPSEQIHYDMTWRLNEERYPHDPPEIQFHTPIFHPLVDANDGKLCEGVLSDGWKPTTSALEVLQTVIKTVFLHYGNAEMPSNADAAKLLAQGGKAVDKEGTPSAPANSAFAAEVERKKALIP